MAVQVRFDRELAELAGALACELDVCPGATTALLLEAIRHLYPRLSMAEQQTGRKLVVWLQGSMLQGEAVLPRQSALEVRWEP